MQPRNPAVREGLIFGAGLAVLLVINSVLSIYANIGWGQFITLLAGIGAMLFAGVRAGQATGRVNAGLIAGLVTGLFSSAVNLVVVMALTLVNVDKVRQTMQTAADAVGGAKLHYTNQMAVGLSLLGLVIDLIVASLIGLGLGWLGGRIGSDRAALPTQVYQESLYQGMPQPPQNPPA
jgi:hypothetical protein